MIQIVKQAELEGGIVTDARVSPYRDIAHVWSGMAVDCFGNLDNLTVWPSDLRDWALSSGMQPDEVEKAALAFVEAMRLSTKADYNNPVDALMASGFFDCRKEARAVVVYRLGMMSAAYWWAGIRDATIVQDKPLTFEGMVRASAKINDHLNRGWLRRLFDKVTGFFR